MPSLPYMLGDCMLYINCFAVYNPNFLCTARKSCDTNCQVVFFECQCCCGTFLCGCNWVGESYVIAPNGVHRAHTAHPFPLKALFSPTAAQSASLPSPSCWSVFHVYVPMPLSKLCSPLSSNLLNHGPVGQVSLRRMSCHGARATVVPSVCGLNVDCVSMVCALCEDCVRIV